MQISPTLRRSGTNRTDFGFLWSGFDPTGRFKSMPLSQPEILEIIVASRRQITAAAWLVVRDVQAAEDIFQNVALKAYQADGDFSSASAAMSWAFVTARREAIDWLRRRRRESPVLSDDICEVLEAEWSHEASPGADSYADALQECLTIASETSRKLLRLRYLEERACKEVAAELGLGLDAVYQRLSRVHRVLRTCVEQRLKRAEVVKL